MYTEIMRLSLGNNVALVARLSQNREVSFVFDLPPVAPTLDERRTQAPCSRDDAAVLLQMATVLQVRR